MPVRSFCRRSFAGIPAAKRFLAENDSHGSLCENSGLSKAMTRLWAMDQETNTPALAIAPGVREVASEDGAVLLDVEQGVCFSLNPIGLKIWELLKKGCSLEQIADALGQEFPVGRPQLVSDAREFIAALEAKQLIRRPNQTTPKRTGFFENLLRRKRRSSAQ
jgi:Coenzyme PQQ synthesis protein D (PqqD)